MGLSGMRVALFGCMTVDLPVLKCGHYEPLKLAVHGVALGLFALCGTYNALAWLSRRERHLAANTILYGALIVWERQHVAHHMAEIRRCAAGSTPIEPPSNLDKLAA